MPWYLWIVVILGGLYACCGILYLIHLIKAVRRGGISVNGVFGWIFSFLLWPLAMLVDAAIGGMLM